MASKRNFKVIIVGGSVAGLSLAKMLEDLGIDFVLLEAYSTIALQVGASIGLLANGLRILDQLDCYDEICAKAPDSLQSSMIRSTKGALVHHMGLDRMIRGRIGYPFIFMDRQTLLQVLYNHIKQKSNIFTSKRVVEVQLLEEGVKVRAEDGSEYTDNIVVGADGICSTVREQMWTLADKLDPGQNPRGEWDKTAFSYFIVGGPQDRVYWFLFFNIGVPKTGKDIPRFTKADEVKLAEKHQHDVIDDDGVTFADLYKTRTNTVLSSLEEVVFSSWYFRRIMTIGDAAHKLHPLGGQGGNCAIETGAMLANNLVRTLKEGDLSESALETCFERVQK